jgi:hypothetical protein
MARLSSLTQIAGSVGYSFLIILGAIYSFRLFGGGSATMGIAGGVFGSLFASGSIMETCLDLSNSLYGKESTAKWFKPALNALSIIVISSLVMMGIVVDEMASALSASTPFAMGQIASKIFLYGAMASSLIVGASYTLTNYIFYRDLQKTAENDASQTRVDRVLNSKWFKNTSLGLNVLGGLLGIFFVGILVSSIVFPPGLGFALGTLIGVSMLVQTHFNSLDKLGVLPTKESLNPLDHLYLFLSKRPKARIALSATVSLLYAVGMFIFPYAVLTNLASSVPFAFSSLASTITGLSLGAIGFLGSLYPTYQYTLYNLDRAKEGQEIREALQEIKGEVKDSSPKKLLEQLPKGEEVQEVEEVSAGKEQRLMAEEDKKMIESNVQSYKQELDEHQLEVFKC